MRGKGRDEVLLTLGVTATGTFDDVHEADVLGFEMPGWYVLMSNGHDLRTE